MPRSREISTRSYAFQRVRPQLFLFFFSTRLRYGVNIKCYIRCIDVKICCNLRNNVVQIASVAGPSQSVSHNAAGTTNAAAAAAAAPNRSKALDDLDFLGQSLLQSSLPPDKLVPIPEPTPA